MMSERIMKGQVWAGPSIELGKWSALQVTHVTEGHVTLRDLDWSGDRCPDVEDVQRAQYLQADGIDTHFRTTLLEPPPSYRLIGTRRLPFLNREARAESMTWRVGQRLARRECEKGRIPEYVAEWDGRPSSGASDSIRIVLFTGSLLDIKNLAGRFPNVQEIRSSGAAIVVDNVEHLLDLQIRSFWATVSNDSDLSVLKSDKLNFEEISLGDLSRSSYDELMQAWSERSGVLCDLRKGRRQSKRGDHLLPSWGGSALIPNAAIRGSREVLQELAESPGRVLDYAEALRECVNRLNELDAKYSFIESEERDDLIVEILSISKRVAPEAAESVVLGIIDETKDW